MKKSIFIILMAIIISGIAYYVLPGEEIETTQKKDKVNALTIYHWWTSPGESAAINALIDVFADKYPGTIILPSSITGKDSGGGSIDLFNVIQPMISASEAPDVFQINGGYAGERYTDGNHLEIIDSIWESKELEKVIPPIVQDICKVKGHYYAVPVNIHRTNVVWYNKKLLDENNIDPEGLDSWDKFFEACEKLKNNGIKNPIQMGAAWTAGQVFEGIVASIGIDFYEDWINGKLTDPDDPRITEAFETFKKYISYVNPDNPETQWNTATDRVIRGEGAFNIMGDWNNGEFEAAELKYGTDYGTIPVPGTKKLYALGIDTFQHPKGSAHPVNAYKWLEVVSSREGQDAFNPLKGSISARLDSDITKYGEYQKTAMSDFWQAKHMYPTLSNGTPIVFADEIQNILTDFIQNPDSKKAVMEMTTFTKENSETFTRNWILE